MARYWICTAHKDENNEPLRFTDEDRALQHREDRKNDGDDTCSLGVRSTGRGFNLIEEIRNIIENLRLRL
jgi:hypothetical protein